MAGRFGALTRGASGGLSRLSAAIGGGDIAEQQGYDAASQGQSRIGLALAQIQAAKAKAAEDQAKAGETAARTAVIAGRPQLYEEQAALQSGADVPLVRAIRQSIQTGKAPSMELPGPTEDGGPLTGPLDVAPEQRSKIAQALSRLAPLLAGSGDIKVDDWAKAQGEYGNQDLRGEILSGARDPKSVALAQRAMNGDEAYAPNEYGVTDLFSGKVDDTGGPAQRFGQYRQSSTAAQKANAEMNDGMGSGGKAPAGYRWAPDGRTLESIPGGPADPNTKGAKPSKQPTESQAKALLFGSRMAVADEILSELASAGTERPGAIKGAAEATGNILGLGTDTFGGALSDLAGKATNWTQSDAQQSVDQAQRDFINAVLRRESGAVINPGEFRNAEQQYFPQPNDSLAVKRQKAANRKTAISGIKAEAGEASDPEFQSILKAARETRKPASKGGATGSWGSELTPGQRNVTVSY